MQCLHPNLWAGHLKDTHENHAQGVRFENDFFVILAVHGIRRLNCPRLPAGRGQGLRKALGSGKLWKALGAGGASSLEAVGSMYLNSAC